MTGRDLVVVDNVKESRYEILVEWQMAAAVVHRWTGSTVALLHTVIDPEWEGRGRRADFQPTPASRAQADRAPSGTAT